MQENINTVAMETEIMICSHLLLLDHRIHDNGRLVLLLVLLLLLHHAAGLLHGCHGAGAVVVTPGVGGGHDGATGQLNLVPP